jgi:hypothetical protein
MENYNFCCRSVWQENRYLTLREEYGVRVIENKVLRRIFGQKRDEVTGGWRKLHKDLRYSLPSRIMIIKSRTMKWPGYVARMGEKRNVYK